MNRLSDNAKRLQTTPWFTPPKPYLGSRQATVVGAGLAGVSIACHLNQLGWKVTLIDKNEQFAMATSGNPAGLVKPQVNYNNNSITTYYNNYFQYFRKYLKKLLELSPDIQFGPSDLFDKPNVDHPIANTKTTAWLSPIDLCRAQLAMNPSIKTLYNAEVTVLRSVSGVWHCLNANGKTISETPICVLSGGYEINSLLTKHGLPIEPLAGQISLLSENAITPPVTRALVAKHYLIPLNDKSYVCGASHHRDALRQENQADHDENLAGLAKLLPNHYIDKTQITSGRTGVRAVSPDHLPIVGGVIDETFFRSEYDALHHGRKPQRYAAAKYQTGLFVLGALGSHGIGNSPFLGQLLSELIHGSISDSNLQTLQLLHPARFLIRELKRKPADRKKHLI